MGSAAAESGLAQTDDRGREMAQIAGARKMKSMLRQLPWLAGPVKAPSVVACAENVRISADITWLPCRLEPGTRYRLRALTEGAAETTDRTALVLFDGAGGGEGLRESERLGPIAKLRTTDGLARTDIIFTVKRPVTRLGLRAASATTDVVVRTLAIDRVVNDSRPIDFFFSFDVEAAVSQAKSDPIDTLVWGKLDGGEYGLRRICDVLEQHRLVGNFLVDFATCTYEGERPLRNIVDFLAGRGHEVHMHLHPSGLGKRWGIDGGEMLRLEKASYDMQIRMLEYTTRLYQRATGNDPRVFRSGAYMFNREMILASGALGIEMLTNVRENVGSPLSGGDAYTGREPFRWENGVLELPVDASSPEVSEWSGFMSKFDAAVRRKPTWRTFNIVMHSWSMMRKNSEKIFEAYEPRHEQNLHRMCELATKRGKARGYAEYLDDNKQDFPSVRLSQLRSAEPIETIRLAPKAAAERLVTCVVCDMSFAAPFAVAGKCPVCGSHARHRVLRNVLDEYPGMLSDKRIVAAEATELRLLGLLPATAEVKNHDATALSAVGRGWADAYVGLHLINDAVAGRETVKEVARVLKAGGVFVSTARCRTDGDQPAEAGMELAAYLDLLGTRFDVSSVPGYDHVTGRADRVFLAIKKS
ncbi:hypothetical protein AB0H43_36195 [Hamadaea sp. NPDC050747]|uniref:hypothetical protein n=1 Tax=Hamadaea sp. NPDC050747 TaxID=3155789 RepID=UPI0033E4C20C